MTLGPILAGIGFVLMATVADPLNYWTQLLPGILLFAIGLTVTVAPLTSAVSRIAGLIGIAMIGIVVGPQITTDGFKSAVIFVAGLLIVGGLISLVGIRNTSAEPKHTRS